MHKELLIFQITITKSTNGGDFGSNFNLSDLGTATDEFVYIYRDGETEEDLQFLPQNTHQHQILSLQHQMLLILMVMMLLD